MNRIQFTEDEIHELSYEGIHHGHPIVRRRMQALLLNSQGLSRKEVACLLKLNESTVKTYFRAFREGRVETLKRLGYEREPSVLEQRKDEILPHLEAHPVATLKEAKQRIEAITGVKRSLPQVSAFLKKTGLRAAK